MLKACWDCIAGYDLIRDQQGRNEDPHSGVHLNGTQQGAPWQSLSNGNMFPTPALRAGNQIIIKGQLANDRRLNLTIATSYSTVLEIKVANRPADSEDSVQIISHGEAVHSSMASDLFLDGKSLTGTQYIFRFEVNSNGSLIDVFAGIDEDGSDAFLESVAADVGNIRTISATGEVEKLTFIFK